MPRRRRRTRPTTTRRTPTFSVVAVPCGLPRWVRWASRLDVVDVGDVVPGVAVEGLFEALLVEVVADEADGAAEDEEAVEAAVGDELVGFLDGEGAAVPEEIDEADGDAAVDVEDEVRALGGRDLFDAEREVEGRGLGEVFFGEVLDDDDAHVGVLERLDAVADAHDEDVVLFALVDEVLGRHALVSRGGHHRRRAVERAAEARADGEEARDERRDEVLAGARRDDGVVRARHRGAVVGRDHEDHLDELGRVRRELLAEPQERQDAADAEVLREDVRDEHARVLELLAAVVGDGRDEVGGLADHAEPLGPRVVHRDLGHLGLGHVGDLAALLEERVDLVDLLAELGERARHDGARGGERRVLVARRLAEAARARARVAELDLERKGRRARPDAPRDERLGDAARLERLDDVVLVGAADLAEEDEDLAVGVVVVPQQVVDEARPRVPVAADGDALAHAVRVARDYVVELVRHAARLGHVAHRARPVELGGDDVVEHAARVADAEAARLDAADRRGADDADALGLGRRDERARLRLGHALGDDGDRLDLLRVLLERLHARLVDRAERREVHHDRRVAVLLAGRRDRRVHGDERLLGAPVELDVVVPLERVDHRGDRRALPLAHEVKVEHPLHGALLEPVDEAPRLVGELLRRHGRQRRLEVGRRARELARPHERRVGRRGLGDRVDQRRVGVEVGDRVEGHEAERERAHGDGVLLGPEDLHREARLVAEREHHLEALLVVGARAAHEDRHVAGEELVLEGLDRLDEALEGGGDVGEVGDAAADDEDLAVVAFGAAHEPEDGARVVVRLLVVRRARVLAVVRQLVREAEVTDRVGVHDGRAAAGDHRPDAARDVEDGQLERRARLGVHRLDVGLLGELGAAERGGEVDLRAPLLLDEERGGLVDLRGEVERRDLARRVDDDRVDLHVDEVEVAVDAHQGLEERREFGAALLRDVHEQRRVDFRGARRFGEPDLEPQRLGVDVADVDAVRAVCAGADVIVASDMLYERALARHLGYTIRAFCPPARAIVCDPGRTDGRKAFFNALAVDGTVLTPQEEEYWVFDPVVLEPDDVRAIRLGRAAEGAATTQSGPSSGNKTPVTIGILEIGSWDGV
mmetsp:Transcript_13165/g.52746  ORF Transcript_13165/g.52746 Transcript_13165/m.52746 type:complete len:1108 (+) Transcript_13165:373-3696(+)